jgi:hypothetical protein
MVYEGVGGDAGDELELPPHADSASIASGTSRRMTGFMEHPY